MEREEQHQCEHAAGDYEGKAYRRGGMEVFQDFQQTAVMQETALMFRA
jgi:hypothetical protein